jgi:putative DNA methylase
MIPKECKRLAEVDFPIAVVSKHARAEKDSRIAHIPRLHVWPAARPGGACRTILLASLLPDPCDPHCPRDFLDAARAILQRFSGVGPSPKDVQTMLLRFIGDFSNWEIVHTKTVLRAAQDLVKAAHGEAPLVVDPFAGGGMIPLEALRLGCDAVSSDLNPVACLIDQVVLSDMPRYRDEMLETLEGLAAKVKARTEAELRSLYPRDADGLEPVAYLWARTVKCEQPNCGCEIPLIRSFWLAQKAGRRRALRVTAASSPVGPTLLFEIFEPQRDEEIQDATVARANATCIACRRTLIAERVRAQLRQQRGGARVLFDEGTPGRRTGGARLLAVASLSSDSTERKYRLPNDRDYEVVAVAQSRVAALYGVSDNGVSSFPDEATPVGGGRGAGRAFSVYAYGITVWADLFTARQLLAIRSLCSSIHELVPEHLRALVALLISKVIDMNNSLTEWRATGERPAHMLSRWALPMKWDFPEAVPISEASGSLGTALARTMHLLRVFNVTRAASSVTQADAAVQLLPDDSVSMWFTDPPYYDAIPYSDLSDFFFVWLKRVLPGHSLLRDPFDAANRLTPKSREAVQDEQRIDEKGAVKDKHFFERKMREAFKTGRRVLRDDGIGCVVFAHKTTEGWEALLSGIVAAGWVITNSWPLATEMSSRLRARDSAALATSIHLICRPRAEDASTGDWGDVVRELPKRIADWMDRLGNEGIRGADLVFACIGPALELFSKFARVETPDGEEVGLAANDKARGEPAQRGFLSYVWEFAGRTALNQVLGSAESRARNGAAGALEEDARLTALFLWTLQATEAAANGNAPKKAAAEGEEDDEAGEEEDDAGEDAGAKKGKKKAGLSLIYDVARRFAQPLGIHLDLWEGRIIETAKGIVRLLPVGERAKQLFGEEGASAVVRRFDSAKKPDPQGMLDFMAEQRAAAVPEVKGRGRKKKDGAEASPESLRAKREATTLDRVHAAMLLQASGATNALRALLEAEVERAPDFLRLANALSALYPRDSEEKRLLDAMLLAVPR